jgi:pimeloyl-ACP methyl ester carboxylesterase
MNWLLLRGLARQSEHWGEFPAQLARAVPGANVVPGDGVYVLDLPGTGARCDDVSPDTIPAIRECVQASAGHLPRPLILVGLSLGGMVALDWASRQPQGVAGVIAINSSSGWSPFWHRLQPSRWGAVVKLVTEPRVDRREAAILALTSNVKHPSGLLAHWRDLHNRCPVTRRTALRQIRAAARYRPPANPPDMPTLLLASRADRLVSSCCSEKLAQLWGCELAEHPWAGHDLPLDDPEWVVAKLQEFRRLSVHC